jgi:DNA-binding PadR family transcriptional regulator
MVVQGDHRKKLGTTAYAVLGLLALRDWTTYELAQQMDRGIGRMWAASPSTVYEDPKHLVAHGFARVQEEKVGLRPRSRYSITPAGRRALAAWLAEAPAPPMLQFEGLLKVLFADQGNAGTNVAILDQVEKWANGARIASRERADAYLAGDYIAGLDLDDRALIVAQTLGFLNDFYDLVERWAAWSAEMIKGEDAHGTAHAVFTAIARGRRVIR